MENCANSYANLKIWHLPWHKSCDVESDVVDEFVRDYYNGDIDDEKVAEEFGEMMFPEATGRYSSYLGNVLDNIIEN